MKNIEDTLDPVLENIDWDNLICSFGTEHTFDKEDSNFIPPIHLDLLLDEEIEDHHQANHPVLVPPSITPPPVQDLVDELDVIVALEGEEDPHINNDPQPLLNPDGTPVGASEGDLEELEGVSEGDLEELPPTDAGRCHKRNQHIFNDNFIFNTSSSP